MDSFFRILIIFFQFVRLGSLGLAVYGLFLLPRFQNGLMNGPHWLLYLYDSAIPLLLIVGAGGLVILFAYNLMMTLIPGVSPDGSTGILRRLLFWTVGLAFIGGLPSFVSHFSHMQEMVFDNDSYHLIQRATNSNTVEYFVYRCADPIGVWCERVVVTNDLPAPLPTPTLLPTETPIVTGEGEVLAEQDQMNVTAVPTVPTVTPPAELIDQGTGELLFQIGEFQMVLTTTEVISSTVTPAP